MNLFCRRPLALFCCLFAVASLGGCFLDSKDKLWIGLLLICLSFVLTVLCLAVKKARAKALTASLCFLFSALALLSAFSRIDTKREALSTTTEQELELEMTVLSSMSSSSSFSTYQVRFTHNGASLDGILSCEYPSEFQAGNIISGAVRPARIEDSELSTDYYRARGIFFHLTSEENTLSVVGSAPLGFTGQMMRLNTRLCDAFHTVTDEDTAEMLSAIFLGNRTALRDDLLRDFRRAGLSHVLAISGMHLSILVSILDTCLRLLIPKKRRRCVLVLLAAFFYTALTGFSLSTVRAFIMVAFVYIAFLSGSQNDTVTSLFFSLFFILLSSPSAVWDIGLWMSFLAVLGILVSSYFTKKLAKRLHESRIRKRTEKVLTSFLSAIIVSLFANIFVCLPMCLCFDEFSLLSVPSTLIISPLITVLLFLAPLLLLSSLVAILAFLSPLFSVICQLICTLVEVIISLTTKPSGITVSLNYPFVPFLIIPAALLLFLLLILPLRKKLWIPLVPIIATLLFIGLLAVHNDRHGETLTVDYLSFNESEMLVLTTASDAVICDISTGANQCLYDAISLTRERCHVEVSALVLTHYHTRHITTFARNADKYVIRNLYLPFPENSDEYYILYSLIDVAKKKDVHVVLFDRNKELSLTKEISLTLTSPVYLKRSTHPTFALTVSAFGGHVSYLAESAHEADLPLTELSDSDYTILGTHGPKTKVSISCERLCGSEYLFVFDETVLSFLAPESVANTHVVYGSDKITLRLKK